MNGKRVQGFERGRPLKDGRGRPSPYRIDWNKFKVGQDVQVKMDTSDDLLVRRRRRSYSSSANHFGMKVSCSILFKPGFMTIRRLK